MYIYACIYACTLLLTALRKYIFMYISDLAIVALSVC